jgi:hypothetical protein
MVNDGLSHLKIRNYLHRFILWWQKTSTVWQYESVMLVYQHLLGAPAPLQRDFFNKLPYDRAACRLIVGLGLPPHNIPAVDIFCLT